MARPKLSPDERIIIALDNPNLDDAIGLVSRLKNRVSTFKVGPILYLENGQSAIEQLSDEGVSVFLDLKFHDIPNTVAKAASTIVKHSLKMFTLHAMGGVEMMSAACGAVGEEAERLGCERPLVLAVTVLTSHDSEGLREIGFASNSQDQVLRLAELAESAGVDGLVASGLEASVLRREFGDRFTLVVPGIRLGQDTQDQKRVMTPRNAVENGADYLVVGRAVTESDDPESVVGEIINSI